MFSQLTRYASELDVPIHKAELDIRATYDTRGKLRLDDTPSGCEGMTYAFAIESPAPAERIAEMMRLVDAGCHALNTVRNPVPIQARVTLNGADVPF